MNDRKTADSKISRRRLLKIVGVQSAAVVLGSLRGLGSTRTNLLTWRGIALGTEVSIQLYSEVRTLAEETMAACRNEIARLEGIFSLYDSRSAVGRLNRDGFLCNAPAEMIELFDLADRFSALTNGVFDVTVQPLCELLMNAEAPIEKWAIKDALELIDYRRIIRENGTVRFARPEMRVTFNGIAQGYVTDAVSRVLTRRGFTDTLVDIGEKRALGSKEDGRPWRVGVESPSDRSRTAGVIELETRAMATSGGYGCMFPIAGRHHLLDARSGDSRNDFSTVSVLAPTAAVADGLSTCLALMDPRFASQLLRAFPETEAFVLREGEERLTRIS